MEKRIIPHSLSELRLTEAVIDLQLLKQQGRIFKENAAATIVDIGDDIGLIEFHTKANALGDEICETIITACEEGSKNFQGLVIGNYGKHFSAGADLGLILRLAQDSDWNSLDHTIRTLQRANMAIKYGGLPVVAAPFSSALGGGCEVCLHSAVVVVASETHMGLVEAGVGLIPAGGGTKELALRALDKAVADEQDGIGYLKKAFQHILTAKVSRSGEEARQLFLTPNDLLAGSAKSAILAAKEVVLQLVHGDYSNGSMRTDIPVYGNAGIRQFELLIRDMYDSKSITEHDSVIAMHLATVLCGGVRDAGTASEQDLLDLEREAFLSLLGTPKTQERISYLLLHNQPLHN